MAKMLDKIGQMAGKAVAGIRGMMGGKGQPKATQPQVSRTGEPLTDDQVRLWKSRLTRARQHHQRYWDAANKIREEYLGECDAEFDGPRKGAPLNLIASFVHTVLPLVLPRDTWPIVEAKAEGDQYQEGAKRLEAREREVFDTPQTRATLGRAVFDSFFLSGFIHVGWLPRTSQVVAVQGANSNIEQQVSLDQSRADYNAETEPDEPILSHIDYRDVRMDPDARSTNNLRWIGFVMERPLVDIQADDLQRNPQGIYHDTLELKAGGEDHQSGNEDESSNSRQAEDQLITLYTLYQPGRDAGEVEIIILAGQHYREIRHDYIRLGIKGLPIRCLAFHDVGRLWPASPEQFWKDQATAINEFLAEATQRARQTKNVVLVPKTQDDLAGKITSASGNDVIETDDPTRVNTVKLGGVAQETWDSLAMNERLADKVSGVADFQRGVGTSGGAKTAEEVRAMQEYTRGRLDLWNGYINDWMRQLAIDCGAMLLQFQWHQTNVRIDEGGGQSRYAPFSNQDVPAQITAYDFQIDVSQQQRNSPIIREKRAQDRLTILSNPDLQQAAAQEGKRISVTAALEDLLEASGTRDIGRYIQDMPDPMQLAQAQQQDAQMENQTMLAGQEEPVDMAADDHRVHAQVHLQAAEQSPLIAEHLAEHYAYMGTQQPGQAPQGMGQPQQGGAAPSRINQGPAAGVMPQTAGAMAGEAARAF